MRSKQAKLLEGSFLKHQQAMIAIGCLQQCDVDLGSLPTQAEFLSALVKKDSKN